MSATVEPYFERFRRCRGRKKLKIVHLLAPNNLQIFSTELAFLIIMEAFLNAQIALPSMYAGVVLPAGGCPVSNHGDWLTKCHSTIVITLTRAGFNEYTTLKRDWLGR